MARKNVTPTFFTLLMLLIVYARVCEKKLSTDVIISFIILSNVNCPIGRISTNLDESTSESLYYLVNLLMTTNVYFSSMPMMYDQE